MGLKSDLIKVGSSNAVVLLSSLVNGFFLPIILTINGYADYKTYILYASFIGFLHLGFVDGINVKYGGLKSKDLDVFEFEKYHFLFILIQIVATIIMLLILGFYNNEILFFICLAIIPVNIHSFFLYFYQAIGEFKIYAKAITIVPVITIILTVTLYLIGYTEYKYFIFAQIFSYYISVIYLEINHLKLRDKNKNLNYISVITNFIKNLKIEIPIYHRIFLSGFYIMVGNLAFVLFFDVGKWLVKFLGSNEDFAVYTFSISLIGFIIIFVSSVNKTFYPYLHNNRKRITILKFRNLFYILGTLSIPLYFPLKWVVLRYLPEYQSSLLLTAILLMPIPGIFIVKSLYVNLYKVEKREKKFLADTIKYLLITLIISVSFYLINPELISIAFASVFSIYIWAIFPANVKYISKMNKVKEISYIILVYLFFWFLNALESNIILSMLIMFAFVTLMNFIFHNRQFKRLLKFEV